MPKRRTTFKATFYFKSETMKKLLFVDFILCTQSCTVHAHTQTCTVFNKFMHI